MVSKVLVCKNIAQILHKYCKKIAQILHKVGATNIEISGLDGLNGLEIGLKIRVQLNLAFKEKKKKRRRGSFFFFFTLGGQVPLTKEEEKCLQNRGKGREGESFSSCGGLVPLTLPSTTNPTCNQFLSS